jgi:hypothetical protein
MGLTSTPFLTFSEISIENTDLFEDAFGLNVQFADVISTLETVNPVPDDKLVFKTISRMLNKTH